MNSDWLTSKIIQKIEKKGEIALVVALAVLFVDYLKAIDLNEIWPPLVWVLWGYLILNVGAANVLKYWRNKDNPLCPKCRKKLNERKEYECSDCGKLIYKKGII